MSWGGAYTKSQVEAYHKPFTAETGIKVNVVQEPWDSFLTRFSTEMAANGDTWDMVVGDSQWLGQGSTEGWYVNMTDFLVGEGIADTVTEATLTYYGEYPTGSGNYWAFPTEGDADGWAYRQDLFEDPDEMAAFEAEYGYPLAVPETYDQLIDIAGMPGPRSANSNVAGSASWSAGRNGPRGHTTPSTTPPAAS